MTAHRGRQQEQRGRVDAREGKALPAHGMRAREERDKSHECWSWAGDGACRRLPHLTREFWIFSTPPSWNLCSLVGPALQRGPAWGFCLLTFHFQAPTSPISSASETLPLVSPQYEHPEPAPPSLARAVSQP